MLINIIIGCLSFALGFVAGAALACYKIGNAVIDAGKLYKTETGNDFIAWVETKSVELRITKLYEL